MTTSIMPPPDFNQMTRSELMKLPRRKWDKTTTYHSLLILPARTKHSSGYRNMVVIGVKDDLLEIITENTDDLAWSVPYGAEEWKHQVKTDCIMKNGALRFWSRFNEFTVGSALSSVDIRVSPKAS